MKKTDNITIKDIETMVANAIITADKNRKKISKAKNGWCEPRSEYIVSPEMGYFYRSAVAVLSPDTADDRDAELSSFLAHFGQLKVQKRIVKMAMEKLRYTPSDIKMALKELPFTK